jgi:LysM repeat protein
MIQIARCYGVTISALRDANPQITDLNLIWPYPTTGKITVPNIGSASTVYGPPCVNFYTVRSGDTWASIAKQNNACLAVLQEVNGAGLTAGTVIKIPLNSTQLYCPSSPASPAVTANPSVTQTPGVVAQRITLGPGETNAVRVGVINPNETIQFVINAPQGSVLGVKLTAPANEVSIGVTGPTGLALKPLDPTPTWNTTITTGGDHYITLQSVAGTSSKSYTLEVSLTPPNVPATATATATATP